MALISIFAILKLMPKYSVDDFQSRFFNSMSFGISIVLIALATSTVILCIKNSKFLNHFQLYWWLPQTLSIVLIKLDEASGIGIVDSIVYHAIVGFNQFFEIGFGNKIISENMIFFRLNILPVFGIIIAMLSIKVLPNMGLQRTAEDRGH